MLAEALQQQQPQIQVVAGNNDSGAGSGDAIPGFDENDPSTWGNPGRNAPCPCGSGKKFKHCHGAN